MRASEAFAVDMRQDYISMPHSTIMLGFGSFIECWSFTMAGMGYCSTDKHSVLYPVEKKLK